MAVSLRDLAVLDLSSGIPGAYAARLLADGGAHVERVEAPGGDPDRATALWRFLHHGVDTVDSPGNAGISAMVRDADVVLLSDAQMARQFCASRDPDQIVAVITPYGMSGPCSNDATNSFIVEAESGSLASRGHKWAEPFMAGGRTWEWIAGAYCATAIAAAWRRLLRSGRGETIDVSLLEATHLAGASYLPLLHRLAGSPEISAPARVVETPEIHPTQDGWVGFTTNSAQQFQDFLILIDRPDLLADEELAVAAGRQARHDEWTSIVNAWTSSFTTDEIVSRAQALRIPVAPVLDASTITKFPHFVDRHIFIPSADGTFLMPRRPWRDDDEADDARAVLPERGSGRPLRRKERASPVAPPSDLPLAGVRVVDLTAWWAGPSGTHLLAVLGADVVHIESPRRLDGMRMTGGAFHSQPSWWDRSAFFLSVNSNKRGLTLDLEQPAGREALARLVRTSDVVVENFTPRVLENLGIGWEWIHKTNPEAVLVRMPAFGLAGPWKDNPGFAQTMEQLSGLAWQTGEADGQPHNQRGPSDPNGGVHAAFATILALLRRDVDGRGRLVEVPFIEVALNAAAEAIVEYAATGRLMRRNGNRSSTAAPQGIYPCRGVDRWVGLSVETDEQWKALVDVAGSHFVRGRHDYAAAAVRQRSHDDIDKALRAWLIDVDAGEVAVALRSRGVPACELMDPRLADAHEQHAHRRFFEVLEHPVVGSQPFVTVPFRLGSVDRWLHSPAPTVGEHNAEILGELGYSDAELAQLIDDGVISSGPLFA